MLRKICLVVVISCLAKSSASLAAGEHRKLISGTYVNDIAGYFIEKEQLGIEAVVAKRAELFHQKEDFLPRALGIKNQAVWAILELDSSQIFQTVVFENPYPMTDKVELFHFDQNFKLLGKYRSGDQVPLNESWIPYRFPVFKLDVVDGKNIFIFRISSLGPLVTALKIWEYDDFIDTVLKDYIIISACLGAVLVIGIYNLFLFISIRDKVYIFYTLYIIFYFLASIAIQGVGVRFDPTRNTSNWLLDKGIFWGTELSVLFAGLFAWSFLNMKKHMPYLEKIVLFSATISALNYCAHTFIGNLEIFKTITHANSAFMSVVLLGSGLLASYRRYKPAYIYTFAWMLLLAGNINMIMALNGVIELNDFSLRGHLYGGTLEGVLLSLALGYRVNLLQKKQQEETRIKQHYFDQMEKVFYPHQLAMMQQGRTLEETMPVGKSEAYVIAFDIANSTKIGLTENHLFFESVMKKCQNLMNQKYKPETLSANAFRIKELGDGFLCSVGFPFKLPEGSQPVESAYQLALGFIRVFNKEVAAYFGEADYFCGVGIAKGDVVGYFPKSPPKEYDLFGDGIVYATRYEKMRKFIQTEGSSGNVLILQEKVYSLLDEGEKEHFIEFNLKKRGVTVRDEPTASRLYYRIVQRESASEQQSKDIQSAS